MSDKLPETFVDLCLNGDARLEDVDDFVDRWHDNPAGKSLRQFLGMSTSEYQLWLNDPDTLSDVIRSRRKHQPLTQSVNNN